ncbi:MAG: DUF1345 domain-containing protein [Chitinophagaceae bacterium]
MQNGLGCTTADDTVETSYIALEKLNISTSNNIKFRLPGFAGTLSNISAGAKLSGCLVIAAGIAFACSALNAKPYTSIMIGWDLFCALMISLSWIVFATAKADQIAKLAWKNDENRALIFLIVLIIVLVSIFGIILLGRSQDPELVDSKWNTPLSMVGIFFSWCMLHTIFTNHYAHLVYGDDKKKPGKNKGGLDFPGDELPDYLDIAYFSFVIGMTFQVSDVQVTDKKLRQVVLLHGVISFIFNTVIVALTISVVANLNNS